MGYSPLVFPDGLPNQEGHVLLLNKLKVWTENKFESIKPSNFTVILSYIATKPVRLYRNRINTPYKRKF